jgi:SAM-dependent methyltransferase
VKRVAAGSGEYGLDAGTGTGNLAGLFAEAGIRMVGVDQSNEMLKRCRSKFPQVAAASFSPLLPPVEQPHAVVPRSGCERTNPAFSRERHPECEYPVPAIQRQGKKYTGLDQPGVFFGRQRGHILFVQLLFVHHEESPLLRAEIQL